MTDPISRNRVSGSFAPPKGDYTIQKGDTLSDLAEQFKVPVEQLLTATPQISNRDVIREGSSLNIPRPSAPLPPPATTSRDNSAQPPPVERDRKSGPLKPPERATAL